MVIMEGAGSDDPAAQVQPDGADGNDDQAEIAAAILFRGRAECHAHARDHDDQPVEPAEQRKESRNGQNQCHKAKDERDDICHGGMVRRRIAG